MDNLNNGVQEPTGFGAKIWIPYKYQERGVKWLLKPSSALFLPPGLGKTSISLAAFLELKRLGFVKRMLVLAPLKVCQTTWQEEPAGWAQFQHLKIGLAHGPKKLEVLRDMSYDIVLLNYDAIPWAAPHLMTRKHGFEVLLCDEITKLKNISSKRFKAIKLVLETFPFRWGLTGTPAANGLMDLFGQVYVLDLGKRFGRYITHFRLKYFYQEPFDQYKYYITEERAAELTSKLKDLAMYIDPNEWLQLPEFLPIVRKVEFPKKYRAQYDELHKEFILRLENTVITAANAGVLAGKLRQFTGGAVYSTDKVWTEIHDLKIEAAKELVDELAGESLIIVYQFDHERERLLKAFPGALVLKGGMSDKAVKEVKDRWNTGTVPVLLAQPASVSMGLNMQFGGSAICWFTMTYNLEEFIQMNKRLHREGQKHAVRCYMLTMEDTIDVIVSRILSNKDATQQDVFESLKL